MSANRVSLTQIREDLAAAGDPWEAGVTSMSVLSPDEQKARLGVTPPPGTPAPGSSPRIGASALAASVGAPTSFFWGTPSANNWSPR